MITQKFIPVSYLLSELMDHLPFEDDPYISLQFEKNEISTTDQILTTQEPRLFSMLEDLSSLDYDGALRYISPLPSEDLFLLLVAFHIPVYRDKSKYEELPLFPKNSLYQNLFAYVLYCYKDFKKYCMEHNLLLWDAFLDLSQDQSENCDE